MHSVVPWQDTAAAIGTLLAVMVSLGIAIFEIVRSKRLRDRTREEGRFVTAGLVSAWVAETYEPDDDGSVYIRARRCYISRTSRMSLCFGWS